MLAATLSMVVFFCALITLPLMFSARGVSESQIGLYLAFVSLIAVIFAGLMPRAVASLGPAIPSA